MIFIIFLICIILIVQKWYRMIPIYVIASIWINPDVRLGHFSFITILSIFIIVYGFIKKKELLTYKSSIDKNINNFFSYSILIYIPFILLGTDLGILAHIGSAKNIIAILVGLIIWKSNITNSQIKRDIPIINISLIILGILGIYSYLTLSNPFIEIIQPYCSIENLNEIAENSLKDQRGQLQGRISGTSLYTIQYAILLVITFFYIFSSKAFQKKTLIVYSILFLLLTNIYFTGSRGPLGALIIVTCLYIIKQVPKKKIIIYSIPVLFLYFIFSNTINEVYSLFGQSDEINGSSIEGRFIQFAGALSLVINNPQSLLFGRGLGFTGYYLTTFGPHPLALAFESAHVGGLVEYGILGLLFIYLGKFIFLLYLAQKAQKANLITNKQSYILKLYLLAGIIYTLLVGEVYSNFYIITFFIILKYNVISNTIPKKKKNGNINYNNQL